MINEIFADMIGKTVLVYLDDVTIFTKTFKQHLTKLKEVFKRLCQEGLYLKPKKCTFATNTMKFLGYVVNKEGLQTDLDKVAAVTSFPRPMTRTEVRAFLGIAMYY